MNKKELEQLIRLEITKQVKSIVPNLVRPLVQEAVAGALANILAEGIIKGPPSSNKKVLTPNISRSRSISSPEPKPDEPSRALSASDRRRLASRFESMMETPNSEPSSGGNVLQNILSETANDIKLESSAPSVLDAIDEMDGVVPPNVVDAITRDYSELMTRMKQRGDIRG